LQTIRDALEHAPSHPSRVRGLKFVGGVEGVLARLVAPFTGAWIEMSTPASCRAASTVAPFTGAWIEIRQYGPTCWQKTRRTLHGCVD